jgi:hypothetical protein
MTLHGVPIVLQTKAEHRLRSTEFQFQIAVQFVARKGKLKSLNYEHQRYPAHGASREKQPLQAPLDRLVANQSTSVMPAGSPLKE